MQYKKEDIKKLMGISDLLENSNFKTNITIRKVKKIIRDVVDGKGTNKTIAKSIMLSNHL